MAVNVTSQIIENGPRWIVAAFTGISDAAVDETGIKVIDAQSPTFAVNIQGQLIVPGVHLKLREIDYECAGGWKVLVQWDATTPVDMLALGSDGAGIKKFDRFGGIPNPMAAGATGSILLSTLGAAVDSTYTIVMRLSKGVPNGPF